MKRTRAALVVLILLAAIPAALIAQSGATGGRRTITIYDVTVISNVRNSSVYVDGELQNDTTPVVLRLRAGTYLIRVEARRYLPWQRRVTVDGNETLRVNLLPPTATVYLEIPNEFLNHEVRNPMSLIDFYIDGRLQRDAVVEVDPGDHEVTIVSGGLSLQGEMFFQAGRVYTIELILRMNFFRSDGS